MSQRPLLCIAATLIAATTLPALAGETTPSRVQLSAPRMPAIRADVSAVCPSLHQQLPDALASAHARVGKADLVRVEFTLFGRQVMDVDARAQHTRYHRWVRRAMQDIDCRSDHDAPQRFVLDLRFVDAQEADTVVAMVDAPTALQLPK